MIVLREMRRRARVVVGPVVGLALIGYFAYNLVEGDRGLQAWRRITQQLSLAEQNLATVDDQRASLDRRVTHLRSNHVDPDLLDTQVRRTLDVVRPDEIVIMAPTDKH